MDLPSPLFPPVSTPAAFHAHPSDPLAFPTRPPDSLPALPRPPDSSSLPALPARSPHGPTPLALRSRGPAARAVCTVRCDRRSIADNEVQRSKKVRPRGAARGDVTRPEATQLLRDAAGNANTPPPFAPNASQSRSSISHLPLLPKPQAPSPLPCPLPPSLSLGPRPTRDFPGACRTRRCHPVITSSVSGSCAVGLTGLPEPRALPSGAVRSSLPRASPRPSARVQRTRLACAGSRRAQCRARPDVPC